MKKQKMNSEYFESLRIASRITAEIYGTLRIFSRLNPIGRVIFPFNSLHDVGLKNCINISYEKRNDKHYAIAKNLIRDQGFTVTVSQSEDKTITWEIKQKKQPN